MDRNAVDRALATARGGPKQGNAPASDDGFDEALTRKHLLFLQQQKEKQQIQQAATAAKIFQFHSQHGDAHTAQLAKGLAVANGPMHIKQIAQHLHRGGAHQAAKVLWDTAAGMGQ